jgi:hypothetical protein
MIISTVRFIILFGFLVRLIVAFWNGFFDFEFGQIADAGSFHNRALYFAGLLGDEYGKGYIEETLAWGQCLSHEERRAGELFTCFLSKIYYWTGVNSLFLSSTLSCIAWLISAKVLLKIMCLLSIERPYQYKAIIIYALLPSSIIITSITLREPYELLLINIIVYAVLKVYLQNSYRYLLVQLFAIIFAGLLHSPLIGMGLFSVLCLLGLYTFRRHSVGLSPRLLFIVPIIALVFVFVFSQVRGGAYDLTSNSIQEVSLKMGKEIENYQKGGLQIDARAHYKTDVAINDIIDLLIFFPVAFFQYLFEPMPWRISRPTDIVLMSENLLRLWLIAKAWLGLGKLNLEKRRLVGMIFFLYSFIEVVWSIGTINWGTAMRHHIPSFGLLLVAAFAYSARIDRHRRPAQR